MKIAFVGGGAANTYIRESGRARRERRRLVAARVHHVGAGEVRSTDRLLVDSADGPATNPQRRRCERCGRRAKFCKCGRGG